MARSGGVEFPVSFRLSPLEHTITGIYSSSTEIRGFPSVATSGNNFFFFFLIVTLGECYGHLADRGQESAKHHTMHRTAPPPGRLIWPKMSIMVRLRNLDLQNQYQKHPFDSVT